MAGMWWGHPGRPTPAPPSAALCLCRREPPPTATRRCRTETSSASSTLSPARNLNGDIRQMSDHDHDHDNYGSADKIRKLAELMDNGELPSRAEEALALAFAAHSTKPICATSPSGADGCASTAPG